MLYQGRGSWHPIVAVNQHLSSLYQAPVNMQNVEKFLFSPKFPVSILGISFSMINLIHFFCHHHDTTRILQSPSNHLTMKSPSPQCWAQSGFPLTCQWTFCSPWPWVWSAPACCQPRSQSDTRTGLFDHVKCDCFVICLIGAIVDVMDASDPPSWWGLIRFFSTSCLGNCIMISSLLFIWNIAFHHAKIYIAHLKTWHRRCGWFRKLWDLQPFSCLRWHMGPSTPQEQSPAEPKNIE